MPPPAPLSPSSVSPAGTRGRAGPPAALPPDLPVVRPLDVHRGRVGPARALRHPQHDPAHPPAGASAGPFGTVTDDPRVGRVPVHGRTGPGEDRREVPGVVRVTVREH